MAGKTLTSSLIVRLIDQVSGPARKVSASLLGLNNSAKGGFGARLGEAIDRNNAALDRARVRLFDAAAGFYVLKRALGAPLSAAGDFETMLEDIGQKAGIPVEQLGALGERIKTVARETNQATMEIGKAVDFLIGMGAKQDTALAVSGPIGRAATAYRAATEDLAKATFAVVDNLKVPAADAALALDAMAKAGKEGGFELRDMAKEFPALTAAAQFLGMEGVTAVSDLAAALEVARKGAADGAQAANNMANFMQKLTTKETIKNFKKFGVNVSKELAIAEKKGISPIEHMLEVLNRVTKGGDAELISRIFGDKQVLEFIRPMLANMDEYRRIREEAMKAQGTVEADYERRIKTALGAQQRFAASIQNLNISLGQTLLPLLNDVLDKLLPVVEGIGRWAEANPELARTIIAATAALIGFKVAVAGLSFLGLLGRGGALSLLALGFGAIGKSASAATEAVRLQTALAAMSGANYGGFAKMVDGIKAMALAAPGVGLISTGLTALGAAIAAISAPVLATVAVAAAAIGTAGFFIYKYWDRLTSIFTGVGQALGEVLAPAIEPIKPLLEWLGGVGKMIGDGFKSAWDSVAGFFGSLFSQETLSDQQKEEMRQAGYNAIMAMLEGMKQMFNDMLAWFASWPGQILAAIGSIDLGSLFKRPDIGAMFGGGQPSTPAPTGGKGAAAGAAAASGARAGGGPVWKGSTYRINEKGQEFFSPGRSGTIHKAGSSLGGNVTFGDIIVQGASDPEETANRVVEKIESRINRLLRGAHSDSMARA